MAVNKALRLPNRCRNALEVQPLARSVSLWALPTAYEELHSNSVGPMNQGAGCDGTRSSERRGHPQMSAEDCYPDRHDGDRSCHLPGDGSHWFIT